MRAAMLREYGEPLEIVDIDRPTAPDDGVVLELEASGICRSDWHTWQGHLDEYQDRTGEVLGHEPAGTVVEAGPDVETVREGDEVAIPFNYADGTCPMCRQGHTHLCDGDVERAGAWTEEIAVPNADTNAIHLPGDVSSREMAGLGCRFMTSFHGLAHRAAVGAGDWVAVHGCGGIGLSAVDIATALGGNVVAVDVIDEKLDMAADLGAVERVNADRVDDVGSAVRDVTDGGADVSVDALGIAETTRNSIESLRKRGQHLQIGVPDRADGAHEVPVFRMITREIDFLGSLGMPHPRFGELFRIFLPD